MRHETQSIADEATCTISETAVIPGGVRVFMKSREGVNPNHWDTQDAKAELDMILRPGDAVAFLRNFMEQAGKVLLGLPGVAEEIAEGVCAEFTREDALTEFEDEVYGALDMMSGVPTGGKVSEAETRLRVALGKSRGDNGYGPRAAAEGGGE